MKRDVLSLARAVLVCSVLGLLNVSGADWPWWRGPERNGISRERGWSAQWPGGGPKVLWKASVGVGFSSLAVSGGRVFTLGYANNADTVWCLDEKTGAVRWKFSYPAKLDANFYEGGPSATPTVAGEQVYTLSKRGVLLCLEAATGRLVWSNNVMETLQAEKPTWGFAGSVVVDGDLCLLNAGSSGAAFEKETGKLRWFSGTDAAGYSTPVPFDLNGERVMALCLKQDIALVRVRDGHVLWRHPWKTEWDVNAADPILTDGRLFISSGYNHGGALLDIRGETPRVLWENKNMRNHFNPCVLLDGYLYGIDGDANRPDTGLKCVSLADGSARWGQKTGMGGLIAADGKLIVMSEKGELIVAAASPEGFKPLARAQVLGGKCWTTPVLANGKIYCRNAQGNVVCLDVSGS
jgi:outer membrane protein assembly factor BamB